MHMRHHNVEHCRKQAGGVCTDEESILPEADPPEETVTAFLQRLASRGVTTLVRRPRGRDVGGACGQLAGAARRVLPLVGT